MVLFLNIIGALALLGGVVTGAASASSSAYPFILIIGVSSGIGTAVFFWFGAALLKAAQNTDRATARTIELLTEMRELMKVEPRTPMFQPPPSPRGVFDRLGANPPPPPDPRPTEGGPRPWRLKQ